MRLLIFILVLFAAVAVYTDTGVDFEDTKTIDGLLDFDRLFLKFFDKI